MASGAAPTPSSSSASSPYQLVASLEEKRSSVTVWGAAFHYNPAYNIFGYVTETAGRIVQIVERPGGPAMIVRQAYQLPPSVLSSPKTREVLYCCAFLTINRKEYFAMAGKAGIIRLIDCGTGREFKNLVGHCRSVNELATHPIHRHVLASGSNDLSVRVWDARLGLCLAIFGGISGHRSAITSVSWSPDGTRLASGGMDRRARVWEVPPLPELTTNSKLVFPAESASDSGSSHGAAAAAAGSIAGTRSTASLPQPDLALIGDAAAAGVSAFVAAPSSGAAGTELTVSRDALQRFVASFRPTLVHFAQYTTKWHNYCVDCVRWCGPFVVSKSLRTVGMWRLPPPPRMDPDLEILLAIASGKIRDMDEAARRVAALSSAAATPPPPPPPPPHTPPSYGAAPAAAAAAATAAATAASDGSVVGAKRAAAGAPEVASPAKRHAGTDTLSGAALARGTAAATAAPCSDTIVPDMDAHPPLDVLVEYRFRDRRRWWPRFDLSVEGNVLACGGKQARVFVFTLDTGALEAELQQPAIAASQKTAASQKADPQSGQEAMIVLLSPGGRYLVCVNSGGHISLFHCQQRGGIPTAAATAGSTATAAGNATAAAAAAAAAAPAAPPPAAATPAPGPAPATAPPVVKPPESPVRVASVGSVAGTAAPSR